MKFEFRIQYSDFARLSSSKAEFHIPNSFFVRL